MVALETHKILRIKIDLQDVVYSLELEDSKQSLESLDSIFYNLRNALKDAYTTIGMYDISKQERDELFNRKDLKKLKFYFVDRDENSVKIFKDIAGHGIIKQCFQRDVFQKCDYFFKRYDRIIEFFVDVEQVTSSQYYEQMRIYNLGGGMFSEGHHDVLMLLCMIYNMYLYRDLYSFDERKNEALIHETSESGCITRYRDDIQTRMDFSINGKIDLVNTRHLGLILADYLDSSRTYVRNNSDAFTVSAKSMYEKVREKMPERLRELKK